MKEMANQEEVNAPPGVHCVGTPQGLDPGYPNLVEARAISDQGNVSTDVHGQEQSDNCASLDLAIQSEALSVSLRSRASLNPETISLSAQVRLLTDQLAQVAMKLDEANYKIGFLEGQMFAQREKFEELRTRLKERQTAKKSLVDWLKERLPFSSNSPR